MAATAFLLMSLLPDPVKDEHWVDRRISLLVLLASCVLTLVLSFFSPGKALFAFLLNGLAGTLVRLYLRRVPKPN
jgi:hypothetical protein